VYLSCGPGLLAVRLAVGVESQFWYAGLRAGGRYECVRPVLEPSGMQILSSAVGSLTSGVHAPSALHRNIAGHSRCAGPTTR
jgi:hypothetical protein